MIETMTRTLRDNVARLGLADAAFWLYGKAAQVNPRSMVANARYRREGAPDGLPIPPSDLIFLVASPFPSLHVALCQKCLLLFL